MKKIILVLAALAVTSVAAFAGPTISVGGGFGGKIVQNDSNNCLEASPVFSIKGDFQWEKFGVSADFDFNLNKNAPWTDGNTMIEELYVNPYANFNLGDFNFNVGPLLGLRFVQISKMDNYQSTYVDSENDTSLFFGGSINCNYKITDKLNAYLEIPVIANNMAIGGKTTIGSTTSDHDFFYYEAALEVIPKFGLTYTF